MRTLIYVPVIHTSADLGSLAKDISRRGVAELGGALWEEHKRTVEGFWRVITDYFVSLDVSGMKIYQDGMAAEGRLGEKIAEETAKAGSKNYELILRLLKKGALLVKTEDFALVKKERDRILKITQAKSTTQRIIAFIKYKLTKNGLLEKRDKFIAKRIDETLEHGQMGIIFIGACHNIARWLPANIQVSQVKDALKIRQYQSLLPFYHKHKEEIRQLDKYLTSKIEVKDEPI